MKFALKNNVRISGAFTLIELLVVISIIAMLTSVLLPSLQCAKELSKKVKCLANQRTLGLAVQMYCGEYDGKLPESETWVDGIFPFLGGSEPANPMLSSRDNMPAALFCPSDKDPYPRPYMTGTMEVTSYFVNGAATDFAMGSGNRIALGLFGGAMKLDDVKTSSECMMLGETTNYGKVADLDHTVAQEAFAAAGGNINDARSRFHHRSTSGFYHSGSMSIYFTDGHGDTVCGIKSETLSLSQWPGGAMMSNETTFYPSLSLPTAMENPEFWGPPYDG